MDQSQEHFSALVGRFALLWRTTLDERLRPWGMTYAAWRVLRVLMASPAQRFHQTRLAKEIGVETPTLVSLLDRMERRQWVLREHDPLDRRVRFVTVTQAGKEIFRELGAEVDAVRQQMCGKLSPEELHTVTGLFQKLLSDE